MVSCTICKKDFKDKRGLYGHSRLVHGIDYRSGKPAKKTAPTEVTKEEIEKINKGRELTKAIKEKEFQTHSLDRQIDEAKEEIKQLNVKAKEEINRLSEEIKQLNKGVRDVRDKSPIAGSDSVTPVIPTTSQKEGEKSTQPSLKRENIDDNTARSNRREEKGMLREIYDDSIGEAVRDIRDILPRPRGFFRRRRQK